MTPAPAPVVERFRGDVEQRFGLAFDDSKLSLLREILDHRAAARHCHSALEYLERYVESGAFDTEDELHVLADRLTVCETYFFRNQDQFRAFAELVIPVRVAARGAERVLRVLSAGCASGEEPYSIAMALRGVGGLADWQLDLRAIDLNPAALEKAAAGRYSSWSMRETPAEMRARYFRDQGKRGFLLDEAVRQMVAFEQRNLSGEDPGFWTPSRFDAIFCRNVLMYFSPAAARATVAQFARALAPGGFLFLGHAETLRGVSTAFSLKHSHGAFYYQLREGADEAAGADDALLGALSSPEGATTSRAAGPAIAAPHEASSWMDAIQGAARHIEALSRGVSGPPLASPSPRQQALELLVQETGAVSTGAVGSAGAASLAAAGDGGSVAGGGPPQDLDAQLVRALVLVDQGHARDAQAVCQQILRRDELNAAAHYVQALCCEHLGDPSAARTHDQYALYLDPAFAISRLHLGLMARRAGERAAARRELSHALALLAREDPARIVVLGGGFSREDLMTLCRAELRACGGEA